jgi:hypothetical protein
VTLDPLIQSSNIYLLNIFAIPSTLTGAEEKKTGPSRFRPLFSGGWVDTNFTDWHEFRSREPGVSGGACQVPSFRSRGCRGAGMAMRTASSEPTKGNFHVRFSRGGGVSNVSPLARQFNAYHPPTLYVNIKNPLPEARPLDLFPAMQLSESFVCGQKLASL